MNPRVPRGSLASIPAPVSTPGRSPTGFSAADQVLGGAAYTPGGRSPVYSSIIIGGNGFLFVLFGTVAVSFRKSHRASRKPSRTWQSLHQIHGSAEDTLQTLSRSSTLVSSNSYQADKVRFIHEVASNGRSEPRYIFGHPMLSVVYPAPPSICKRPTNFSPSCIC